MKDLSRDHRRRRQRTADAVAARVRAEAAQRESLRQLEEIKYALDQSAIVAMTDVQGTITYVNDKFCTISKYSREELLGQNHRMLNSGIHPLEFFKTLYHTIANGQVWRGEIRNRAKDSTFYWVDTTIVPFVGNEGKPYQYIVIRSDITERKTAEAKLSETASLAKLGRMAAVVAHEVRNPLAGIRGALQVIGGRIEDHPHERKIINEVIIRIDTLSDIVQDLLFFARPRHPVLARVAVLTLAHETIALAHNDPALADVRVDVDAAAVHVDADREMLKMALLNLVINGAQAMGGAGVLRIDARDLEAWHELRVSDHGPGLPPEVREHLFEPFFTTKHRGTGLGLSTTRRIVEAHGGTIEFECPVGGGTIATIRLPRTASTADA